MDEASEFDADGEMGEALELDIIGGISTDDLIFGHLVSGRKLRFLPIRTTAIKDAKPMLTPAQKTIVRNYIIADSALNAQPLNSDGAVAIAAVLNVDFAPAFTVWKTSVDVADIMATGFDWTRVDNSTVGRARIWEWIMQQGTINPSKLNIRDGITAAWSVSADATHLTAILSNCKRNATVAEKILATGTGTLSVPALLDFSGPLTYRDVEEARAV